MLSVSCRRLPKTFDDHLIADIYASISKRAGNPPILSRNGYRNKNAWSVAAESPLAALVGAARHVQLLLQVFVKGFEDRRHGVSADEAVVDKDTLTCVPDDYEALRFGQSSSRNRADCKF